MAKLRIDCDQFEQAVQARLDARLSLQSDPILVEHALECEACRESFDEFVQLEAGLVAWSSPAAQVVRETESAIPVRLSHGRFGGWGLVASIAAVLLVCLMVSTERNPDSPVAMGTDQAPAVTHSRTADLAIPSPIPSQVASPNQPLNPAAAPSVAQAPMRDTAPGAFSPEPPQMSGWSGALAGLTPPPALFQPSSFRNVSYRLSESLIRSPYYRLPAQLPGVRPLESSLRLTVDLLEQTFQDTSPSELPVEPDLGMLARDRAAMA